MAAATWALARLGAPSPEPEARSPEARLRAWTPNVEFAPPVTVEEAMDLAEIGEAEKRCDARTALHAYDAVKSAYPHVKPDDSFSRQAINLFGEHHPDVVREVAGLPGSSGAYTVQRREEFLTIATLNRALSAERSRRFGSVGRARLALAFLAANADVLASPRWQFVATVAKNGDGALALCASIMKEAADGE